MHLEHPSWGMINGENVKGWGAGIQGITICHVVATRVLFHMNTRVIAPPIHCLFFWLPFIIILYVHILVFILVF